MKKILSALLISSVLLTSCKKDDAPATEPVFNVDANGNVSLANDAAGAMYAIYSKVYDDNDGAVFFEFQTLAAWYGDYVNTKDAGIVKSNSFELEKFPGSTYTWYFQVDATTAFDPANGIVAWDVQGNSVTGIAGFTHSDNVPFPSGGYYTLPASIDMSNSYTISHTAPGNVDGVVYSVIGNKGEFHKAIMGNSTSVTFTSAEMNEAAFSNDAIGFSVMPVKVTTLNYNEKKYGFVKQFQQLRETITW